MLRTSPVSFSCVGVQQYTVCSESGCTWICQDRKGFKRKQNPMLCADTGWISSIAVKNLQGQVRRLHDLSGWLYFNVSLALVVGSFFLDPRLNILDAIKLILFFFNISKHVRIIE